MNRNNLRTFLATAATLICLGCIVATVYLVLNVSVDHGIRPLPFNDVASKSIETRLKLAETLFQIALLMTGALWALVIAKKDEIRIVFAQKAEVVMFVSASLVLLLSTFTYAIYLDKISHQFAVAVRTSANSPIPLSPSVPDIFDQNVNYLFIVQAVSLIAGIFNGLATLISTHKLRGGVE